MLIDIPKTYIETDNLNYLTYSGNYYPGRNTFDDGHIVLHQTNGNQRKCYKDLDLTITHLKDLMLDLYCYFFQQGAHEFCLLHDDTYLININNTKDIHLKSLANGYYSVEAEFNNGETLQIFKGRSEEYAKSLIMNYKNTKARYNQLKVKEKTL